MKSEACVRGEAACCAIKTFIDVTHQTLVFYSLHWKVVIYLAALFPRFCGLLRDGVALTKSKRISPWMNLLPPFPSFILHSSVLDFPHSFPSFGTWVLPGLSFPAGVWCVRSPCTFHQRSGDRTLFEGVFRKVKRNMLENNSKHST